VNDAVGRAAVSGAAPRSRQPALCIRVVVIPVHSSAGRIGETGLLAGRKVGVGRWLAAKDVRVDGYRPVCRASLTNGSVDVVMCYAVCKSIIPCSTPRARQEALLTAGSSQVPVDASAVQVVGTSLLAGGNGCIACCNAIQHIRVVRLGK
jgi:hypothetical protein